MEKHGFVYLWRDRKHRRYYIGSHWGTETDGYVCSSRWMRKSFKRRPEDFKRRVLSRGLEKTELLAEEHRWLDLIKDDELGKKYYNLTKHLNGHWSTDEVRTAVIAEKISKAEGRRDKIRLAHLGKILSEETKEKIRQIRLGSKHSEETKKKISESHNRTYDDAFREKMSLAAKSRSTETRTKISENSRRLIAEGRIGMKGRSHSPETRAKMSASAKLRATKKSRNN